MNWTINVTVHSVIIEPLKKEKLNWSLLNITEAIF